MMGSEYVERRENRKREKRDFKDLLCYPEEIRLYSEGFLGSHRKALSKGVTQPDVVVE